MGVRPGSMAISAAAAALLLLAGCQKKTAEVKLTEAPPVTVKTARVENRVFTATVAVTGSLISNTRVDVKAETTGRLLKFAKEEGEPVKAGEVVAWVDQENSQLAMRQADSAVKVAEAGLERARVNDEHARYELERAQNLVKSGGITDRDLKTAQLAQKDASAQVLLFDAQLAQARATLATANKHLRDTEIHAPVAGEIQRKFINTGAYVEPATAMMTLVDNSRLEVESLVASSDIAPIRQGQRVSFTVNSFPGVEFQGRVIDINPAVDAETRSAKIRVQVDNSAGRLKAGMFAQGEILTGVQAQAIIIPAGAVYRDDRAAKDTYVFVVENNVAVKRAVRIGRERPGELEIVSGLKPGDVLITEQSIELAEGVRVAPGK
jgi:membrane fusion protein, multidrug efflux system